MFGQGSARFRTTEFFGVVLPGFWLLLQLAIIALALLGSEGAPPRPTMALESIEGLWAPALVLLLFLSYLIGSTFRASAVSVTDELCWELFHQWSPRRHEGHATATRYFPYAKSLAVDRQAVAQLLSELPNLPATVTEHDVPPHGLTLQRDHEPAKPSPSTDLWVFHVDEHDDEKARLRERIYSCWKHVLCEHCPPAFEYVQAAEARTRFLCGMISAARGTVTIMFVVALLWWCTLRRSDIVMQVRPLLDPLAWPLLIGVGILAFRRPRAWLVGALASLDTLKERLSRRVRFWGVLYLELGASVAFFHATTGGSLSRVLTIGGVGALSLSLFVYFGRRLRRTRGAEMCTVHIAYCLHVLVPSSAPRPAVPTP